MIDYVEIRNATLVIAGIIDTAESIIWNTDYFGAGQFEIYTAATSKAVALLQCGSFVTRVDSDGIGIIEAVEIVFNAQSGRMITASGRLAKSILDRRLITYVNGHFNAATIFSGNVEARARGLVQDNAIACYKDKARTVPYTARNISILQLGTLAGLTATTDSRQVSFDNLLEYTDDFLRSYGYGAKMILRSGKLNYTVYSGTDRSIGNNYGNEPVIFSEDFDNLIGSKYKYDEAAGKSFALVGGEGEGLLRYYVECGATQSGLARRETWLDAKSIKREIIEDTFTGDGIGSTVFELSKDATNIVSVKLGNVETTAYTFTAPRTITFESAPYVGTEIVINYYDNNIYDEQLETAGEQALATLISAEAFEGNIDLTNSSFIFGSDFVLGDIVTVQDNSINKYLNVRIISVTEVQDDSGYQIIIKYEAV